MKQSTTMIVEVYTTDAPHSLYVSPLIVPGVFICEAIAHQTWGSGVPSGDQGRSPSRRSGDESETVCRRCLQILTAEAIKI